MINFLSGVVFGGIVAGLLLYALFMTYGCYLYYRDYYKLLKENAELKAQLKRK